MKSLLKMNPAEIEEMRERQAKRYELGVPPGIWRLHEDCGLPPDWAMEMDDDEKFQREMGAQAIWVECAYCGVFTKSVSSFCNNQCKRDYIELKKTEKQRTDTMKFLRKNK